MPSPEASRKNWGKAVEGIKNKKQQKIEMAKEKLVKCRNAYVGDDEEMEEKINRMAEMGVAKDIINGKDQDDTPEESESDEECDFTDIIAEKMAKMKIRRKKAEAKKKVSKKPVPEPEPDDSESEESESEEEEEPKPKKGRGKKSNISVNVYNQSEKPSKKEKNNEIEKCFLKF